MPLSKFVWYSLLPVGTVLASPLTADIPIFTPRADQNSSSGLGRSMLRSNVTNSALYSQNSHSSGDSVTTLAFIPPFTNTSSLVTSVSSTPATISSSLNSSDFSFASSTSVSSDGKISVAAPSVASSSPPGTTMQTSGRDSIGSTSIEATVTKTSPITSITSMTHVQSSAGHVSTEVVGLVPIIQSWIKDPSPAVATKAIDTLEAVKQDVQDLFAELKPNSRLLDCTQKLWPSGNQLLSLPDLLQNIFCTITELKDNIDLNKIDVISSTFNDLQAEIEDLSEDSTDGKSSNELTETTSLSSGSCSAATLARQCKVICSTNSGVGPQSMPCSTTCSSTISGCNLSGTTSTTMITSVASGVCAADCGTCNSVVRPSPTNPCPTCATGPEGSPIYPPITRTALPGSSNRKRRGKLGLMTPSHLAPHREHDKRQLIGPEMYGSIASFITNEVQWAVVTNQVVLHRPSPGGETSASVYPFSNQPLTAALHGLYGCTSVVVISTRGAWISHIWEVPTMQYVDESAFQENVLDPLRHGDGTPWMYSGIGNYTTAGAAFSIEFTPQAFIITPQASSTLMYPYRVSQLANTLYDILPNRAVAAIIPYTPAGPDPELLFPHGKLLLQYDPFEMWVDDGQGCPFQAAGARLWWEDQPWPIYEQYWPSLDDQLVPIDGLARRNSGSGCLWSSHLSSGDVHTSVSFPSSSSLSGPLESAQRTRGSITTSSTSLAPTRSSSPFPAPTFSSLPRTSTVIFSSKLTMTSVITITSADTEAGPAMACGLAGRTDCPLPTRTETSTIVWTSTSIRTTHFVG